ARGARERNNAQHQQTHCTSQTSCTTLSHGNPSAKSLRDLARESAPHPWSPGFTTSSWHYRPGICFVKRALLSLLTPLPKGPPPRPASLPPRILPATRSCLSTRLCRPAVGSPVVYAVNGPPCALPRALIEAAPPAPGRRSGPGPCASRTRRGTV